MILTVLQLKQGTKTESLSSTGGVKNAITFKKDAFQLPTMELNAHLLAKAQFKFSIRLKSAPKSCDNSNLDFLSQFLNSM